MGKQEWNELQEHQREILHEWNNYKIITVVPQDIPRIKDHFRRSFYQDSIFSVHAGYSDDYAEEADSLWMQRLGENLSLIVTDSNTNDVAGVLIVSTHTKSTGAPKKAVFKSSVLKMKTAAVGPLQATHLYEGYGVDRVANLGMTSVDRKYRGQGISYELFRHAICHLTKKKGFQLIKVTCASPYIAKVADKLGFKEVGRIRLIDLRDEKDLALVPNAKPDEMISLAVLFVPSGREGR